MTPLSADRRRFAALVNGFLGLGKRTGGFDRTSKHDRHPTGYPAQQASVTIGLRHDVSILLNKHVVILTAFGSRNAEASSVLHSQDGRQTKKRLA